MKTMRLFALVWSTILQATLGTTGELDDIKLVVSQAYDEIWSDLDVDAIDDFHTSDFTLLNNGEDAWSNFDVVLYLKRVKKLQSKSLKRTNSFEFLEHKIYQDVAWITFYNTAQYTHEQSLMNDSKWLESAVLIKQHDQWKFQLLHTTTVANP